MTNEQTEEQSGDNIPKEGLETQTPTTIDKYHEENNRRAELLKQETELQDRKERLHTEQMLGGRSEAGQAPPEKKESTPEEYAKQALAGELPDG